MQRPLLALALAAAVATPCLAQIEFNRTAVPGESVNCGEYAAMSPAERVQALQSVEPVGGELADADPALVEQWAGEVAATCGGDTDRPLDDAAAQALGGN
jgi:hypothetical protein